MTVFPNHSTHLTWFPVTFSVFQLMIELKSRQFDITEVIKAESQVALNTLKEHNFQDAFKKMQTCWEWCIQGEED
jgi:hypothetical protein